MFFYLTQISQITGMALRVITVFVSLIKHSWTRADSADERLMSFAVFSQLGTKKEEVKRLLLVWYLLELNQGHMDFQSIALPPELRYLRRKLFRH